MPKPPLPDGFAASADRIALLQTFVRIVESGSLSAAAAQMEATQPTVSRRLQTLERALGVRLLQRSTHSMALTEDGERCFARAREMLTTWHAFEADLRGAGDEPEGTLRVVAPHAFGQGLLVGPVADYLARHPGVTVEWLLHDRPPDFIAGAIDCAIQVGDLLEPTLVAIRLSEVTRIAVAAPALLAGGALPRHPDALAGLPWLALRTYYRNEIVLSHAGTGETCRLPIRPRLGTDSLYALRSAALLGTGVAVVSAWMVQDDLAAGRLLHLVPDWQAPSLPMHLVYPYARHYPAKLRRFVDTMRRAMAVPPGDAALPQP